MQFWNQNLQCSGCLTRGQSVDHLQQTYSNHNCCPRVWFFSQCQVKAKRRTGIQLNPPWQVAGLIANEPFSQQLFVVHLNNYRVRTIASDIPGQRFVIDFKRVYCCISWAMAMENISSQLCWLRNLHTNPWKSHCTTKVAILGNQNATVSNKRQLTL